MFGLTVLVAALAITCDTAHAENYSPPTASIVVDGTSGAVLQASNPDALRHPASLTKIMTLYLLFERLEAGKFKLDSPLKVSEYAAEQAPTKLGLKPGQTIAVEDAIKAIVTKSANDAAVVVAENLGGDESNFAKLMTQKARALGMTRTTYINASGLPDDDQTTTARDQALLGRLIQKRFPRYYKYFSTESFVYHGEVLRNHNHLLGSIEGVDGIKTGFTRASGFNVVTSVHRDGHYIVAVVMGGRSSLERDAHMRELISAQIEETALKRSAPAVAKSNPRGEIQSASANAPRASQGKPIDPVQPLSVKAIIFPTAPVQSAPLVPVPVLGRVADNAPQPSAQVAARWLSPGLPADAPMSAPATTVIEKSTLPLSRGGDRTSSNQSRLVKTITIHTSSVQSASLAPMPEPAPVATMTPQPSAQVAARWLPSAPPVDRSDNASARPMPIAQTSVALAFSEHAKFKPEEIEATKILTGVGVEPANAETVSAPVKSHVAAPHAPASAQNVWLIQIGAFDNEDEARQHLSTAQLKARDALAAGHPLTERVQKGDKVLYRARFTGFDKETAEAACQQLRRSDMDCVALKN
ncbi:MAG TPA: serine hydrolase [Xanthobacteraceae bacterium]